MTLAKELGHEVVEQPISRDQLYIADEVFVTGTAAEVIGLREIDFRTIGSGRGTPVTRALQQAYPRRRPRRTRPVGGLARLRRLTGSGTQSDAAESVPTIRTRFC